MSLNDIPLNFQLLADLFAESLVETNITSSGIKPTFKYLGNNKKNILIIVNNDSVPFLEDHELSFLTSILTACRLSMADVALINSYNTDPGTIQGSFEILVPEFVLLFGTEPLNIGLPIYFPHFQLQRFNSRTYVSSPSFPELENDKALKTKLWNSLKTLFGLS